MKRFLRLGFLLLFMAGCSNDAYGLDKEKVEISISEEAIKQKVLKDNEYKKEDIKIIKICKVMDRSDEVELEGVFRVYWQTKDQKHNDKFILKNYKAEYGNNNYLDIEDSCKEW